MCTGKDVVVIILTIEDNKEKLRRPIGSILATDIARLIIVTTEMKLDTLSESAQSRKDSRVEVAYAATPNKCHQLLLVLAVSRGGLHVW